MRKYFAIVIERSIRHNTIAHGGFGMKKFPSKQERRFKRKEIKKKHLK